jgi:hypothetical protein
MADKEMLTDRRYAAYEYLLSLHQGTSIPPSRPAVAPRTHCSTEIYSGLPWRSLLGNPSSHFPCKHSMFGRSSQSYLVVCLCAMASARIEWLPVVGDVAQRMH